MATRRLYIERILRQIYNGQPTDDSEISVALVNEWLNNGISIAAKNNYKENYQLEGIGFLNNSFYSKFKGIAIVNDEVNLYRLTLPEVPLGIGSNEGVSTVIFKNSNNELSFPGIPLNERQIGYSRSMREIPNKIMTYPEGNLYYAITSIDLTKYTATVTMASGGDSTNLDSVINVPGDYFPVITDYIKAQLVFERKQLPDLNEDGRDI